MDISSLVNVPALRQRHPHVYHEIIEQEYRVIQFKPELVRGRQVVDVGAHVGVFSLLCQACGAGGITCVELNPDNFSELSTNVSRCPSVTSIMNRAVSDGCSRTVHVSGDSAWSQTTEDRSAGKHFDIPCISLEDMLRSHVGDDLVMKMDIEGDEYKVLPSCSKQALRKCGTILLETHNLPDSNLVPGKTSRFLIEYMRVMGFDVLHDQYMFDGTPNFQMIKLGRRDTVFI